MTSTRPPSEAERAFAAQDLRAFERALRRARPAARELDRWLRAAGEHDALRLAVLRHLDARVQLASSPSELEALAAALPAEPDTRSPDVYLLLAELYRRLWPWHRSRVLPRWRERDLPAPAALAWARTELVVDPAAAVRSDIAPALLRRAAAAVTPAEAPYPELLVAELTAHPDAALHREALRLSRACLARGAMLPRDAHRALAALLDSPDEPTVTSALAALAEPWARRFPLRPPTLARAIRAPARAVSDAALRCASATGARELLEDLAADPALAGTTRRAAFAHLGACAARAQLGPLLDLAAGDAALFGPVFTAFLRAMHRRGLFVPAGHAPRVLEVYLAVDALDPAALAPLLFPCRDAVVSAARAVPPDDARWPRLASLLVALALGPQGATPLPIAALLRDALRDARAAHAVRALVTALGALRDRDAEPLLLARLECAPREVLAALAAVGADATRDALRAGLGVADGTAEPTAALRPVARDALALLWRLCADDPAARDELVAVLDPAALPACAVNDLGARPAPAERALLAHAARDPARATEERVVALAHGGAADAAEQLEPLLLRLVTEVDHGEVTNPRERGEAARSLAPRVLDAIRALGAQRFRRGHIRPVCLLECADERAAGDALLADLLHRLLARPDLASGEAAVVLRALAEVRSPRTFAVVHRLWRSPDPVVRALVLRQLARDGAAWMLAINLRQLLADGTTDLTTLRAAVEAVGAARDEDAADVLAACLDHPNMNVKKSAAEALATFSAPAATDALLAWLARHDNPGLRADLVAALRHATGDDAFGATVLAAIDALTTVEQLEPGRRLLLALDGVLTPEAVHAVARRAPDWSRWFLEQVFGGAVRLAGGARASHNLAAQVGWQQDAPRAHAGASAHTSRLAGLAADGWSDAAAREALARLPKDLAIGDVAIARAYVREWLGLAAREPACADAAVRLLAQCLAGPTPAERAALADHLAVVWSAVERARGEERAALLRLVEAALPELSRAERWDVARRWRALPVQPAQPGERPFALLRACDVVLTREDLARELAACEGCYEPERVAHVVQAAFPQPDGSGWLERDARARLEAAARDTAALRALAAGWSAPPRATLRALVELFERAAPDARGAMLDWMEALQPLDAPRGWLAPDDAPPPRGEPRPEDLDQPPSRAQLERLEAQCSSHDAATRRRAQRALLRWPTADVRRRAARRLLAHEDAAAPGETNTPSGAALADEVARDHELGAELGRALADLSPDDLAGETPGARTIARVAAALAAAPQAARREWIAWLLSRWGEGSRVVREALARRPFASTDELLEHLAPALEREEWHWLALLAGRVTRTAWLERVLARAEAAGHTGVRARLTLEPSGLRAPGGAADDARALVALGTRRAPAVPLAARTRAELIELARGADPDAARGALSALAKAPDAAVVALLRERTERGDARTRLHAHRLLRRCADKATYLAATMALLGDTRPDVRRSAVRALAYGDHADAIPAVIARLEDAHAGVRREADAGLVRWGAAALGPLRHAAARARPDRRAALAALIARIEKPAVEPG